MKRLLSLLALMAVAATLAACDDAPTTPTASPTPGPEAAPVYTATLLPSSEVPPVTGNEAGGSGTATLTMNLSRDGGGAVSAATLDVSVNATGFPVGTALTASHLHPGAAGANGGVFVSFGLTAGEVTFPTGSGSFNKRGISLTVDQANAIMANPSGFYVNIHTAGNPNGVARGQLARR
jgi:hypothetical protein